MRWEADTNSLDTPGDTQKHLAQKLIAKWDILIVENATQGKTGIFGCDCGKAGTRNAAGACCEWASMRIDRQTGSFEVGTDQPKVRFISFNVQYGTASYAAINVQVGATFTQREIRGALVRSLDNHCRVWVGNQGGKTAYEKQHNNGSRVATF
jgi:hypothetical protein